MKGNDQQFNLDPAVLLDEQMKSSIGNYLSSAFGIFLATVVVYLIILQESTTNKLHLHLWLFVQILFVGLLLGLYYRYRNDHESIKDIWEYYIEVPQSFATGLGWGVVWVVFIDPDSVVLIIVLNGMICGLLIGYVMSTPLHPPAGIAGMLACIVPVLIKSLWIGGGLFNIIALGAVAVFGFTYFFGQVIYKLSYKMLLQREENTYLAASLKLEKEQVEKISQEKTHFLAAASHDLRQPLQAMKFFEHALDSLLTQPEQREVLRKISASNKNLSNLLEALLDISKLDSGALNIKPERVCLDDLFHHLYQQYSKQAAENKIELRYVSTLRSIYIDPYQLERMLSNLIVNAIKHMGRPGKILLGLRWRANNYRIEVWDNGRGVPFDSQNKIFDEFYQVNNPERNNAKGVGLGLASTKRLVMLLSGNLLFRSVEGRYSYFALQFPHVRLPEFEPSIESVELQENIEIFPILTRGGQKNILIIEDDITVLDGLNTILTSWGYQTQTASCHKSALQTLDVMRPDFILTDYQLKNNETGLDAIEVLRKAVGKAIPALILTGNTNSEILKMLKSQPISVLHKPVQLQQLQSYLATL